MAEIIDGKVIAEQIRNEIASDVELFWTKYHATPGLAVVLVGDNPASHTYVTMKAKMCERLGMYSVKHLLPESTSEATVLSLISNLNSDNHIHGILVQLPLPNHLNPYKTVSAINPFKDVDGLHPENIGLLCIGQPRFQPCTPLGICELLTRSGVPVPGKEVVILGRSNLVGRPLSIMLSSKRASGDASVTLCHSRSNNIADICRRADILVAAIGQRQFVTKEMVKPGAVVIDVGTHPPRNENEKFCGDVEYDTVSQIASKITPVPGGVGPMTIASLMKNTLHAAQMCVNA
jgi:methylenetetrahydrofolate dehydrogenase (NADP+) / methenyltetrahydrofolate cyclohydrolase